MSSKAYLYLGVALLVSALVIQLPFVKPQLFQTVVIDNDLPVVSDIQPSGDYYINGQPLTASAKVTDATSGVYHVFFYLIGLKHAAVQQASVLDESMQGFSAGSSDGNVFTLSTSSGTWLKATKSVSIDTNNYLGLMIKSKGSSNVRWVVTVNNGYGDYWLQDGGIQASQAHPFTLTGDYTVKYFAFSNAVQSTGTTHTLVGTTITQIGINIYSDNGAAATFYCDWLLYPYKDMQSCASTAPSSGSRNDGVWKATFAFSLTDEFDTWEGIVLAQAADQASPWNVNGQVTALKFVKQATYSLKWIQPSDNAILSGSYKFIVECTGGTPTSVKIRFTQSGILKYEYTLTQESGTSRWSANIDTTKIASGTYTVTAKAYKDGTEVASLSMVLSVQNEISGVPFGTADWLSIGMGVIGLVSIIYSRKTTPAV